MAVNTASTLIKFLLEPAPLEHLLLGVDSAEHHKIHLAELVAQLDTGCTQLQQDARPHLEGGNVQVLINNELADELVIELGSQLSQATE